MNTTEKNDIVIRLRGIKKSFGSHVVLDGFSLEIGKGESVVVIGKSGSGKSVLIKCIIGLHKIDDGLIEVNGVDINTLNQTEMDKMRAKVGFLFQSNALYDSMTVQENLLFPMRRHMADMSEEETQERITEKLRHVGLEHTINMMPAELSGGMKKRIALARTLVLNPDIVLYDEPTTGLDPITGKEISLLIRNTQKTYGTSSMIISHDMGCVERTSDRVAILLDGKCYAVGTYKELKSSGDKKVQAFFE